MRILATIHRLDVLVFSWCMACRRRTTFTQLSRYLSLSADGPLYVVVALALYIWHPAFTLGWLQALLVAITVERCLYLVMKKSFRRNRPQEAITGFRSFIRPADQFSFPSGHTSCAFLFAVMLAHVFPQMTPVLMVWASSIGFSRVFLGVHFPTDTLMGALMGSSIASFIFGAMIL